MATATVLERTRLPAIARREDDTIHLHARGELGAWLDEWIARIAESLTQSQQWQEISRVGREVEDEEEEVEPLDVFSLRYMPPEDSFVIQVQFVDAGEGEPARYDFSEVFDEDEEEDAEAE